MWELQPDTVYRINSAEVTGLIYYRRGRGIGWPLRCICQWRGKSELHRAGCWVTPRRGNSTDSATETYRYATECWQVRVKSGGKSSRPIVVTRRRASPTRSKTKQGLRVLGSSPGWLHEIVSNCGPRWMATLLGGFQGDRTRLTDSPAPRNIP